MGYASSILQILTSITFKYPPTYVIHLFYVRFTLIILHFVLHSFFSFFYYQLKFCCTHTHFKLNHLKIAIPLSLVTEARLDLFYNEMLAKPSGGFQVHGAQGHDQS